MVCQTSNTKDTIGIYVSEEQEFYRQLYQNSFQCDSCFNFLGNTHQVGEAELCHVLAIDKPEILLIGSKRLSGDLHQELERISQEFPQTSMVILLTSINGEDAKLLRKIIQKCRSGIAIYMKQSLDNPRQLNDIIKSVNKGQVILDPEVASVILMEKTEHPFMKLLTEREMEILNCLSQGYTNHGIAHKLCIDVRTVAHHLNNIYSKLKEQDETEDGQMHPRVSVARLYLETTGELLPFNARNSVTLYP
jgi:DNA-binding NarL/FixJ family response regulator